MTLMKHLVVLDCFLSFGCNYYITFDYSIDLALVGKLGIFSSGSGISQFFLLSEMVKELFKLTILSKGMTMLLVIFTTQVLISSIY